MLSFSPHGQVKTWLGFRIHLSGHPEDGRTLAESSTVKITLEKGMARAPTIKP